MSRYGKETRDEMARLGITSMGDAIRMIDALKAEVRKVCERDQYTETKRLREAIETHRLNIWGHGEVNHDEDVQLYAVLGD